MIEEGLLVTDVGLRSLSDCGGLTLGFGVTMECFHDAGICAVFSVRLKRCVTIGCVHKMFFVIFQDAIVHHIASRCLNNLTQIENFTQLYF